MSLHVSGASFSRAAETMRPSRFLKTFDFEDLGKTVLRQSQVFYATSIATRLIAGTVRSVQEAHQLYPGDKKAPWKNLSEPREHALRDVGSFFIFYFVSPLVQRGILRMSPHRDILVEQVPPNATLKEKLKMWINGPFVTIDQLKDREKLLKERAGKQESIEEISRLFKSARAWHHSAYLTGLAVVFVSIGVGVGKLNIYLAKRDLERRKKMWESHLPEQAAATPQSQNNLAFSTAKAASTWKIPATQNAFGSSQGLFKA